jgi:RNA polymerase sigma factor (sigma-70 family)
MAETDLQLLARYNRHECEDAFAEIVRRHLGLVYSAALRQVRSPQLAEEVAQIVFLDLARQSDRLAPNTILTAWLYQVTRRTAIDVVRRESRRQLREQIATEMNAMNATSDDWRHVEPLLDEAMEALDATDRTAVLLRYFENKSLREVGTTLGTSDDAAQKRVSRAVERLREFFTKRGVSVGASGLAIVISANAVQAAPAGLAISISTAAALAGTSVLATTAASTATKAIVMTTLQKAIIGTVLAATIGAALFEAHQTSRLRDQVQTLQQEQQDPLAGRIQQLERERDDATNRLALLGDEVVALRSNSNELLKLRSQATRLQAVSRELAQLKSTLAEQTNATRDFLSEARVTDLGRKTKQAFDQLADMKKGLNLTHSQEQAIGDIMMSHLLRQSKLKSERDLGNLTPEQEQTLARDNGVQETEIKALFTPAELAAYPEYTQAVKIKAADGGARFEAGLIADDLGLAADQQEQIRASFYQMILSKPTPGATDAASTDNLFELESSELNEKLSLLGGILTPEQLARYRQREMNRINDLITTLKKSRLQYPGAKNN